MRWVTVLEEDEGGPRALVLDLVDDAPPLGLVHRWSAEALSDLTVEEVEDCLLVVTEPVANAYDHGRAPRRVRLDRSSNPRVARIEVDDAAPGEVVVGRSTLGAARGRAWCWWRT